jgi:acetylornithine deacetylase
MATRPSKEEIVAAVEKVFEEAVAMLSELVAIDSTLNHETAAVAFMEARFKEAGLATDRFPVVLDDLRSLPGFSPVDWSYEGKECVVGVHRPRLPPQGPPRPIYFIPLINKLIYIIYID